jgi:SAM-dependent methyltransferase
MPSSSWKHISPTIEKIWDISPKSVLDIGIGFGKWGFLLREYLEIGQGRYNKSEWLIKIDGIEIFEPYILDTHRFLYDQIFIGDAQKVIDDVSNYDLIIVGDILEHLPKDEAVALIEKIIKKGKKIIINIPLGLWPQEEVFNNPHEEHISSWCIEDFEAYDVVSKEVFHWIDGSELLLIEIKGLHC